MNYYSPEFKEEVLNAVANGLSVSQAAMKYNIHPQSIRNWRAKNLEKYGNDNWTQARTHDIEEKVDVIRQAEEDGKSIREIALETGINMSTIRNWIKDRNHIYAVYYAYETAAKEARDSPKEEKQDMDPNDKARDEHLENKALKEENQYLKARVLYLEKLMELNGTPAPDFKKKQDTKLSGMSSRQKE
jgi:transposase-like protein